MPTIRSITARQILDSRGRPTVEATVTLSDGTIATSSVPSGNISNENHEAIELRDHVQSEFFGYGVSKAVEKVGTEINDKLAGLDPLYQTKIDQTLVDLDGTKNKSRLGANAILAVSQAVIKAAAASLRLPLFVYVKEKYQLIDAYRIPSPIFNLINGGRHGGGTLDFQEFQLVPASHLPYSQALKIGVEMFMAIEEVLQQKGALTNVGLEGGFAPNLASNTDALEILTEAAKTANYTISMDAFLGIDVGPSNFFKSGKYTIKDRPQPMSPKDFIKYLKNLHEQYRVFAFEDPLVADAWGDWKFITSELGSTAMIMADDLIATNKTLLMKAIEEQACNALVIKPNRIGTITEAIEVASLAKKAGWHTIMSHRSSETTDDILADIAVGIGTDYVKFGAPSRGERVVKYNRLLRIEEILLASTQPQPQTQTQSQSQPQPNTAPAAETPQPASAPPAAPALPPEPSQTAPTPGSVAPPTVSPVTAPAPTTSPSPAPTPAPAPAPAPAPVTSSQMTSAPASASASPAPLTPAATEPATTQTEPAGSAEPEIALSIPTSAPATPVENNPEPTFTPTEVFADPDPTNSSPSPAPAPAPTPTPTPAPTAPIPENQADVDEIQDSLNELVQMVEDIPVTEEANVPDSTPATTEGTDPSTTTVTPTPTAPATPAAAAPTFNPTGPITESPTVNSGLPRPVPPMPAASPPPETPPANPAAPTTTPARPAPPATPPVAPEPSAGLQPPQPPSFGSN